MRRTWRASIVLAGAAVLVAAAVYLHDPPWAGTITSGLRAWTDDGDGVRYRWTNGHASFYVPSDAIAMTLPARPGLPRTSGASVRLSLSVDGRPVSWRTLDDPKRWVPWTVVLPRRPTGRRFRLVELRVTNVIPDRNLGVQLGEVIVERSAAGR